MKKGEARRLLVVIAALFLGAWAVSLGIHSKSGVSHFDQSVWQFFVNHGSTRVHSTARFITSFGVIGFLGPVSVLLGSLLWIKTRSVAVAIAPWASVMLCAEFVSILKKSTNIVRPPLQFQVAQIHNPSFPSGHAANTTALVFSLLLIVWCVAEFSRRTKMGVSISGAAIFIAMGLTRLVLNVHWLSDVLAGWCIGAAVGLAITGVLAAARQLNFDA